MASGPISRQPSCRYCDHEDHTFTRCHAEIGRSGDDEGRSVALLCPCPPHRPNGIYDDSTHPAPPVLGRTRP